MQTVILVVHFIICFLLGHITGVIAIELAKTEVLSEPVANIGCFIISILLSLIVYFFITKPIYDNCD